MVIFRNNLWQENTVSQNFVTWTALTCFLAGDIVRVDFTILVHLKLSFWENVREQTIYSESEFDYPIETNILSSSVCDIDLCNG